MHRGKYEMPQSSIQSLNHIEQTALWAREIYQETKETSDEDIEPDELMRCAAGRCSVPFQKFRSFIHPSRRPKSVDVGIWQRVRRSYVAYLRRKLANLEAEVALVESLDPADGATLDLLDRARSLIRKIEEAAGSAAD